MYRPKVSKYGQWKYPGQETIVPTEDGAITMQGVNYPVLGIDETGHTQMMMPGGEYQYRGKRVHEIPMMQDGGGFNAYDFLFGEDEAQQPVQQPVNQKNEVPLEQFVQSRYEEFMAKQNEDDYNLALSVAMSSMPERLRGRSRSLYMGDTPTSGGNTPSFSPSFTPSNSVKGDIATDQKQAIRSTGDKYGVPAEILAGVYGAETSFGRNTKNSTAGAQGYFQFMPATAKEYGVNPNDFLSSVDGAARYLRDLHSQFGNWEQAVAAYNAGPGNIKKGRYPKETRDYVPKVLATAERLRGKLKYGGKLK